MNTDTAKARMRAYERDPGEIYRLSFAHARAETDLSGFDERLHGLVLRLVHTCGLPDIIRNIAADAAVVESARAALASGAPVLADSEMTAAGVTRAFLPKDNKIICTLNDPRVPALAARMKTTRSAAAVDLWEPHLGGAVIAVGNAPTALFRLLELLDAGAARPAAVFGFPVGFVGAAESKEDLIETAGRLGVPYAALRGRFGGSAPAAAAVNACTAPDQEGASAP
ncbi:MAG: precorrin-8X methylmutase [Rhodospirillales bacterium]